MAKSRLPPVRALDEKKKYLENQIRNLYSSDIKEYERKIESIRVQMSKEVVPIITETLKKIKIPYTLTTEQYCKIASYDPYLKFTLIFDPSAVKELKPVVAKISDIQSTKENLIDDLNEWYNAQLTRIANRELIEEFDMCV